MIIVSLFGGLGNQMFQYAAGKALALKLGTELKLDITHLIDRTPRENFTYRDFELGVFNVTEQIASENEVRNYVPNLWNTSTIEKINYKLKRIAKGTNYYFETKKFCFENRFEQISDNSYVYGYFQTEKYFRKYKTEILSSFELKGDMSQTNSKLIEKLKSENSVSLHIRRGDYENSPFQLQEMDFYKKSIEYIQSRVDNPKFYIFTNDFDWAEQHFADLNIQQTIVKHNQGADSYMDLILMSQCKHNICANSSFSWWGAWLNTTTDKIVIVPEKWFRNNNSVQLDLIPESWIKI